jgi:hypothetical protein
LPCRLAFRGCGCGTWLGQLSGEVFDRLERASLCNSAVLNAELYPAHLSIREQGEVEADGFSPGCMQGPGRELRQSRFNFLGVTDQDQLGMMIGTTRSRVSHFMNKFRQLGYIDYNGDLEVHSSLLDAVLHEKPQIRMPR